jgi:CelD/BcsL family acetyltransferase involved in cellulose biosynthesis
MSTLDAFVAPKSYAPAADVAFGKGASRVVDAGVDAQAATIAVERADGARLAEIESDWQDLVTRAHEPNVFMSPAVIRAAETHLAGRHCVTLLAWQGAGPTKTLVGLWGFAIGRAPHSILPLRFLLSPPVPHGYLATPVIDRAVADDVLRAMLDFIARDGGLPNTLVLDAMRTDGPTMQALDHVLRGRGTAPFRVAQARRPVLASDLDGTAYFEKALSSGSRKKLRQHRRRLAEKGKLTLSVYETPDAVGRAFDEFLALEAAGWKGKRGSALACDPAEAAFARAMVLDLARGGAASVHALHLDGKPVSTQIVLRAGPAAFTWKTAYDEAMHDFSPGMLLLEDYTKAFLADERIERVDSCAYDESGFMAAWSERQDIAQVWIDARAGGSRRFVVLCRLQKALFGLRAVAKQKYLSWRRKWKKN